MEEGQRISGKKIGKGEERNGAKEQRHKRSKEKKNDRKEKRAG
jgi:hypothetical protein